MLPFIEILIFICAKKMGFGFYMETACVINSELIK